MEDHLRKEGYIGLSRVITNRQTHTRNLLHYKSCCFVPWGVFLLLLRRLSLPEICASKLFSTHCHRLVKRPVLFFKYFKPSRRGMRRDIFRLGEGLRGESRSSYQVTTSGGSPSTMGRPRGRRRCADACRTGSGQPTEKS